MECSIQCGRVRKLSSAAPVKAEGGKWLNVSIHVCQSPQGWISGVLASSRAQLFPNKQKQRSAREGVPVAATPLLGAVTAGLHELTGELQSPWSPAGLGWPKCGCRLCGVGRDGSSLPGDKTVDRGAAHGAGACDTPTAVQLCPCRLPLSPSPLGALQPGRWRGAPHLLCCCHGFGLHPHLKLNA